MRAILTPTTKYQEPPMSTDDFRIKQIDTSLHNEDLAPLAPGKRKWGWFEIFNVWSNDIQSLFGYTLAATLFISYGLNGWAVLAGIVLAGFIVMGLVQLTGRPRVKYGIPFPVMARASMGVRGANFPAVVRGIVAIFWYGVQTYFASTAVALLLNSLLGSGSGGGNVGAGPGRGLVRWGEPHRAAGHRSDHSPVQRLS